MKHLPTVEALMDADDQRLRAELEVCQVLEKLARVRAIADRAAHLITTAVACGERAPAEEEDASERALDMRLTEALLASLRAAR
jgi:hypothetical protein